MEDPYALVREHKWTFDKLVEMAKAAATDPSEENRVYGMVSSYYDVQGLIGSTGTTICKKDENDYPYLSFGDERSQTIARGHSARYCPKNRSKRFLGLHGT